MDQITQGASSPQPGPQQIPPIPTATSPVSPPIAPQTQVPPTSNLMPGISGAPSKLKNPKLWIGAGVLLLVVVVGVAIFLGKPPLFPGKSQLPGIPTLQPGARPAGEGAADICAKLDEQKCAKAAERGICAWTDGKCTAAGGAVAPVGPEVKAPGGVPAVIGPVIPGEGKEPPAEPPPAAGALPPPTPAADPLEQLRNAKLESAQDFVEEACNAAREAENKAQEFANVPDMQTAANQAETACKAATAAVVQLKKAATVDEIDRFTNAAQNARNDAVAARDNAIATAEAVTNEAANAAAAARRQFEEFCKANNLEWKDNECILNGDSYKNRQALETALAGARGQKLEQLRKDKLSGAQDFADEACNAAREADSEASAFPDVPDIQNAAKEAAKACEHALAAIDAIGSAGTEDEIHRFAQEVERARDDAKAARNNVAALADEAQKGKNKKPPQVTLEETCKGIGTIKEVGGKNACIDNKTGQPFTLGADGKLVALVMADEVPQCPAEKPVRFEGECFEQNNLCVKLGQELSQGLQNGSVRPEEVPEGLQEINSLTGCNLQAAQFLAPLEEEKAKNECAAKDQSVWEWDAGGKQCKNKQEGRIDELENLVASLQQQLANAQSSNNSAQINALAQQIATLNSQINELRGSADEPVVITVVAPPAPSPAPAPAAPPAAPAPAPAAPPEVKKEEKKDSKKKKDKDKKAASGTESAETAAASASAVPADSAAATAPAKTAAAASGATGAKAASGAAGAASITHGAFIQGRTGPGVLIYPLAVIGANGVYYFLRKRRKK